MIKDELIDESFNHAPRYDKNSSNYIREYLKTLLIHNRRYNHRFSDRDLFVYEGLLKAVKECELINNLLEDLARKEVDDVSVGYLIMEIKRVLNSNINNLF